MKNNSLYERIFDKYDIKITVLIGCIFGALGLLWFHFSGFWTNPKYADINEWIVFFVLCIVSLIFWYLFAKKKQN